VKNLRRQYFWEFGKEEEKGGDSEDEPSVGEEGNVAEPPFMKSQSQPAVNWDDSLK